MHVEGIECWLVLLSWHGFITNATTEYCLWTGLEESTDELHLERFIEMSCQEHCVIDKAKQFAEHAYRSIEGITSLYLSADEVLTEPKAWFPFTTSAQNLCRHKSWKFSTFIHCTFPDQERVGIWYFLTSSRIFCRRALKNGEWKPRLME